MGRKTIAQTLEEKRTLIFNSSKPEILPFLSEMGIDQAFLTTGESLYNEVTDLIVTQKKEGQEKELAYDNLHEAKADCVVIERKYRKIIKMASRKDENLQNRIKVFIPKERNIEPWIKQTLEFYSLVLNENGFLSAIARFGISEEKLNQAKDDLENLKALRNEAKAEGGQAQEATRMKDEKMEKLDDYCYELKTIATIALEDKPQLLEMLGILVRS